MADKSRNRAYIDGESNNNCDNKRSPLRVNSPGETSRTPEESK